MVTIFDVAKESGVSKSTVSRVLNHEAGVKESTKIAVENAIRRLNYSPSYFAQGIRTGKTMTIAVMVPEYTNVFYNELFRGVEDVALKNGYLVLMCNTERHTTSEMDYTEELLNRNIDGIIYNTYTASDEMLRYMEQLSEKVPVVLMNKIFKDAVNIPYVLTDGYNSTRKAVRYLYDKGKRSFGYLRNSKNISVTEERYLGFKQGLADCGLKFEEQFIYQAKAEKEPDYIKMGCEAAEYFAGLEKRPEAILSVIDTLAIGCIQQFKKLGIRVPQDINIVGFDNISLSALMVPSLTTISQPIRKIGQKAAEIIIARINGEKIEEQVSYEGELLIRESTD